MIAQIVRVQLMIAQKVSAVNDCTEIECVVNDCTDSESAINDCTESKSSINDCTESKSVQLMIAQIVSVQLMIAQKVRVQLMIAQKVRVQLIIAQKESRNSIPPLQGLGLWGNGNGSFVSTILYSVIYTKIIVSPVSTTCIARSKCFVSNLEMLMYSEIIYIHLSFMKKVGKFALYSMDQASRFLILIYTEL